jgi:hypothetical protein
MRRMLGCSKVSMRWQWQCSTKSRRGKTLGGYGYKAFECFSMERVIWSCNHFFFILSNFSLINLMGHIYYLHFKKSSLTSSDLQLPFLFYGSHNVVLAKSDIKYNLASKLDMAKALKCWHNQISVLGFQHQIKRGKKESSLPSTEI